MEIYYPHYERKGTLDRLIIVGDLDVDNMSVAIRLTKTEKNKDNTPKYGTEINDSIIVNWIDGETNEAGTITLNKEINDPFTITKFHTNQVDRMLWRKGVTAQAHFARIAEGKEVTNSDVFKLKEFLNNHKPNKELTNKTFEQLSGQFGAIKANTTTKLFKKF